MIRLLSVSMMLLCSAHAAAAEFDLSFNADVVRGELALPLGNEARVDGSWLHNSDDGDVVTVGLAKTGFASPGKDPVEAGLGAKLIYADLDSGGDGSAVSLGGFFRWVIPNYNRIGIGGTAYYAPSVLSFSDVDGYTEGSIYGSYDILQDAWVYVGLRYVRVNFDSDKNNSFDTGFHIGIHLRF